MNVNPPVNRRVRRKPQKGVWMRLTNPKLLREYMNLARFNQSRLADYVDSGLRPHKSCSRQYISLLCQGKRKSCSPEVAALIEEALRVLPGTLFVEEKSPTIKPTVSRPRTAA